MKKKISLALAFVVLFASISFGIGRNYFAKAEESNDFVIGTENLDNTPENSAKVGDQLKLPEKGWKRYDDFNKNIVYLGDAQKVDSQHREEFYNKTYHTVYGADSKVKFKFKGEKLRIIGVLDSYGRNSNVNIQIDSNTYSYNQYISEDQKFQMLLFEVDGLNDDIHEVTISQPDNEKNFNIDAIDIDENGQLLPYEIQSESITLDKTSMDLIEGSSDKITATVSPEDATNKKVVWSSSDESIATVDQEGNITAIKEGQVTITAKVENTDLTATCTVNVKKPVEESKSNAILSISLVNGATKEYDVSMEEVEKFINWFEERANGNGSATYSFNKKVSPYKSVKEYIVHDKIASFEVREYEVTE